MKRGISLAGTLGSLICFSFVEIFSQNIGVGTTKPQARMHIVAPSGFSSSIFQVEVAGSTNPYLIIQPDGKVGIGTANPSEILDVSGSVQFSGALKPSGNAGATGQVLVSQGPNASPQWQDANVLGGDNWGSQVAQTQLPIVGDGTAANPISFASGTAPGQVWKWDGTQWGLDQDNWGNQVAQTQIPIVGDGTTTNPITFALGTAPGQVWKWDGSQWILSQDTWGAQVAQTQSPIIGDGTVLNPIKLQNGTVAGDMLIWDGNQWQIKPASFDSVCSTIQTNYVAKWTGTELCNSLIYDDGVRVGIGTASPRTRLHVYDASPTTSLTISAQARPWVIFHQIGTNTGYAMGIEVVGTDSVFRLNYDRPSGVAFQHIITARNDGFVGLRVPIPQAPLHMTNDGATNGEFLRVENPSLGKVLHVFFTNTIGPITNADGIVYFEIAGSETFMTGGHLISDADGTRMLGNSIHRWQEVWAVNGVIQTSTELEKRDIKPVEYGLETVVALKPVMYKWTNFSDTLTHIGFIAEDVYKVIPEIVRFGGTDNSIKGMSYTELIPVLTKAIQELHAEVQRLKQEVEELRRNQQ
ncbi:MAG: tail fiber domain-containing protein [Chlorobi bacterium]|nr:tail fiber domain-containing protein [Chlorobiota bacterium]